MKYIVSFLLLALMAAPSMAQRPQRGDFKKHDQRVEKHVGEKSCPKCVALKKQMAGLRKRLEEATKGRGKATKGRGKAGKRGRRPARGSRSEGRRGSRGDQGRGHWNRRPDENKKTAPWKRKDVDVDALRKKWREKMKKRFGGRLALI